MGLLKARGRMLPPSRPLGAGESPLALYVSGLVSKGVASQQ